MKPFYEIVDTMWSRQRDQHPVLRRMIEIRDLYNGPAVDYILPYVSNTADEDQDPMTPMLIAEAIDNVAMRASSVMPGVFVPPIRSGKERGKESREFARIRKDAIKATWDRSRFSLVQRRLYRQLAAYATGAVIVIPDDRAQMPKIKIRDPLTSYPDLQAAEDYDEPTDAGFIYGKSANWIRKNFPQTESYIQSNDERLWDLFEWVDAEQTVIGLLGPRTDEWGRSIFAEMGPSDKALQLAWFPNRTGLFPGMIPARVTLDRILSQVMNMVGHVEAMSKLMQLNFSAAERAVYPDTYILSAENRAAKIEGGMWKDGRTGEANVVVDANQVGRLVQTPDPAGLQMVDRLERNFRVSSGLVPQMGGETYGALRTGRGIDTLMGAAVDPRVQELQEIVEAWMPHVNRVILETYKAHWGSKTYSMYTGRAGSMRQFDFVPSKHVESTENAVKYAIPGADVVETNVILQQMVASQTIGRRSARNLHPWVDDADQESALMDEEQMEQLMLQAIMQQIQSGQSSPMLIAFVEEERRKDDHGDIISAVIKANERMQRMQAEAVEAQPGQPAPAEAQPGISGPAQQPVAVPPQTIGPTQGQEGLREVMNAIAATNRVTV